MIFTDEQIKLIRGFINNGGDKLCFLGLTQSMMKDVPFVVDDDFTVIDLLQDVSPFKPFMSILKDKKPAEKQIASCSFSVQRQSFLSYFNRGIADERFDIPVDNEFGYERGRFVKTIVSLLEKYATERYLVLNAQTAFSDTIDVLEKIEKSNIRGKFVFCYNGEHPELSSQGVLDFLEKHSNNTNFLNLVSIGDNTKFIDIELQNHKYELNVDFFSNYNFLHNSIQNSRIFMCLEQLKNFTVWLASNINSFSISEEEKNLLSFDIAVAYFSCNMYDEAILYFSSLYDYDWEIEKEIAVLYYMSCIFFRKKQPDIAAKYMKQLYQKFENRPNSPYYALVVMLDYQFSSRAEADVAKRKYKSALLALLKSNYINNYVSTGVSVPWLLINELSERLFIEKTISDCYDLAIKIDNRHLVSSACHWRGIIASHYGEGDEAMKWYYECNKIRTEIGEIGPLLNIRNGLSYESMCRAKYEQGYNLINEIIGCLYDRNDYSSIVDTLKNVGYILFYSRHYDKALEIFKLIFYFLYTLNMVASLNNSFLPSVTDVLLFKTIIDYDNGDIIHARLNSISIEADSKNLTPEDAPLLCFLQALLNISERETDKAIACMEKCIVEFDKIKNPQFHKKVFVYYEIAKAFKKIGDEKNSRLFFQKGFELARQKRFEYFTRGKKKLSVEEYFSHIPKFDDLKINLLFLREKSEKEDLMMQLHKRIIDYKFLDKIKTVDIQKSSLSKFVENTACSIFEYTTPAAIFVCEFSKNECKPLYEINRQQDFSISTNEWKKLFSSYKGDVSNQFYYIETKQIYFANLSHADYSLGIILFPESNRRFQSETLNTLGIALSSIHSQLIIYIQNENLVFISSTDQISMLNNRHALNEHIVLESERIARYFKKRKIKQDLSIAFIDMDNFKYYNDTFGHHAGDVLIALFAKLLKEICRKIDFIARFGGDEFVVVMGDTNETEGLCVFSRLKDALEKRQHFIPDLEEELQIGKITVEENHLLGFSMGIATNSDVESPDELNKVIALADKALYYSKEHKKGTVSVWSKIKDKLN